MRIQPILMAVIIGLGFLSNPAAGDDAGKTKPAVLYRDDFNSLDNWETLKFPKIRKMSVYSVTDPGNPECYLKAESSDSASAIRRKGEFNPYDYPVLRWRWKVEKIYEKGDASKKSGDDYPIRLYVLFKYDPKDPAVRRSLQFDLARLVYGRYPPYRTLNYIWANREQDQRYIPNTYTRHAMMITTEMGRKNVGRWREEKANILEDYRAAFGEDPPRSAAIAIMNDSDNTHEASISYVDYIEVSALLPPP